jgi:prepilin-type processing-associated H-X9-DG protein
MSDVLDGFIYFLIIAMVLVLVGVIDRAKKKRISRLAILSPTLAVLGFFILVIFAAGLKHVRLLPELGFCVFWISQSLGIAIGIAACVRIYKSSGKLSGEALAGSGIAFSVVFIIVMLFTIFWRPTHVRRFSSHVVCHARLKQLAKVMKAYAVDNDGKYPTVDRWCDLLIKHTDIIEKQFRCPGDKKGPCSYAINSNCEPNSPNDVVLLFETKGGWNQFGGPEILTLENHKDIGSGCNILFNDGHVEFVTIERLGQLRWEDKE